MITFSGTLLKNKNYIDIYIYFDSQEMKEESTIIHEEETRDKSENTSEVKESTEVLLYLYTYHHTIYLV